MTSILEVEQLDTLSSNASSTITIGGTNTSNVTFKSGVSFNNSVGITEADQWRLTADYTIVSAATNEFLTANWERVDTDGYGTIGTGMTESSGVFTFPRTGIYFIQWTTAIACSASSGNFRLIGSSIQTTVDNSSYGIASESFGALSTNDYSNLSKVTNTCFFQFDVTDTSTHKVKFSVYSIGTDPFAQGNSGKNVTYATFIRLGDT